MAGLTHSDLELMMQGIAAPGNAALAVREEGRRNRQLDIEEELRQKMLEQEMRQTTAAESRASAAGEGHLDSWLQDPDGKLVHYVGPPSGMQKLIEQGTAKGRPLSHVNPPEKKPPLMITAQHPDGTTVQAQIQTLGDLMTFHEELKKQGFNAPKQPSSSYGPVQADKAAADLEAQADKIEAEAQSPNMPGLDAQVAASKRASALRARANALRHPNQFETETVTEKSGLPGLPPEVSTSRSRKVPVGTPTQRAPAAGAQVQPAPRDPTQRVVGQRYQTPKGTYIWTGNGWKQ